MKFEEAGSAAELDFNQFREMPIGLYKGMDLKRKVSQQGLKSTDKIDLKKSRQAQEQAKRKKRRAHTGAPTHTQTTRTRPEPQRSAKPFCIVPRTRFQVSSDQEHTHPAYLFYCACRLQAVSYALRTALLQE